MIDFRVSHQLVTQVSEISQLFWRNVIINGGKISGGWDAGMLVGWTRMILCFNLDANIMNMINCSSDRSGCSWFNARISLNCPLASQTFNESSMLWVPFISCDYFAETNKQNKQNKQGLSSTQMSLKWRYIAHFLMSSTLSLSKSGRLHEGSVAGKFFWTKIQCSHGPLYTISSKLNISIRHQCLNISILLS